MNPNSRIFAARRSLDGLSVGDAFGECFFTIAQNPLSLDLHHSSRTLPNIRWHWTDDTAMAICIVEQLAGLGHIDQDLLASAFAARFTLEENRGYGATARLILRSIQGGQSWRNISPNVLSGMGSMGNGGAMRSAPIGAYFADDANAVVKQAQLSAEVTHFHPEGQAGAVAIALAAAYFASEASWSRPAFFDFILAHTPDSETRARIRQAAELPPTYSIETVVAAIGNGIKLTSQDTVPFCLWVASRSPDHFEEAMWTAVSAGGDMDTNCAIVGGILASNAHVTIPKEWLTRREPLPPST